VSHAGNSDNNNDTISENDDKNITDSAMKEHNRRRAEKKKIVKNKYNVNKKFRKLFKIKRTRHWMSY
jgi:hypothetical protein